MSAYKHKKNGNESAIITVVLDCNHYKEMKIITLEVFEMKEKKQKFVQKTCPLFNGWV